MTVTGILILMVSLILMPFCMGLITSRKDEDCKLVWAEGFLYEWTVVFVLSVPCIIKGVELPLLIKMTVAASLILAVFGVLLCIVRKNFPTIKPSLLHGSEIIYLGIFLAIVLFQIYKAVTLAYEDGDDAYYISVAQSAVTSEQLYRVDAYMGIPVEPNYRYALAPFPLWIAILTRLSGISVATISHVVLPVVLLVLTYCIYNSISKLLFDDKEKRYMFMILIAVFFMFENTSIDTQGTFLLTRARQGKEALACIVLPMLFLEIFRFIKLNCKLQLSNWLLFAVTMVAASLTSLFGNILAPIMVLALLIYMIVKKQKVYKWFLIAVTVIPNILTVLIYMVMR